ncbi:hypothetical protein C1645_827613 [Glomus cerebriforme]|uniref:Uncharacterized protein n=1 Tax=Glomus cerebriforme TaxID=658196 RepID=A0A397SRM9_9GLOM|nr:hypothetical protein C1645_827613 [Glomus cerebriforme]
MERKNDFLSSSVWNEKENGNSPSSSIQTGKEKWFSVLSVRYWNQKQFLDFISDMEVSSQNSYLMHLLKESLEIWFASEFGKLKHSALKIWD